MTRAERRMNPISLVVTSLGKTRDMRIILGAALLCAAIGMGMAWAQTPVPSPMSQNQKKAIAKSCSDQANAKGLHGEPRRKFRFECKKAGGKAQ
jgi:hypothetical protein